MRLVLNLFLVVSAWSFKLHEIQIKGTHNSYHTRTQDRIPDWDYGFENYPLSQQLADGIMLVELDIRLTQGFPVVHAPKFDNLTTCSDLGSCFDAINTFRTVAAWTSSCSIIFVWLEVKKDPDVAWDASQFNALEALVQNKFQPLLYTPALLKANYSDVRTRVTSIGWPKLTDIQSRVFVIFDDVWDDSVRPYTTGAPSIFEPCRITNYAGPQCAFVRADDLSLAPAALQSYFILRGKPAFFPATPVTDQNTLDHQTFNTIDLDNDGLTSQAEWNDFFHYVLDMGPSIRNGFIGLLGPLPMDFTRYQTIRAQPPWSTYLPAVSQYQTADSGIKGFEAMKAAGVHLIQTDFPNSKAVGPLGYTAGLGTATRPVTCNPYWYPSSAPCSDTKLRNLNVDYGAIAPTAAFKEIPRGETLLGKRGKQVPVTPS